MLKSEKYNDFSWIKVKRFRDNPTLSWEDRFILLNKHHLQETEFLVDEIRKLAQEYDDLAQAIELDNPGDEWTEVKSARRMELVEKKYNSFLTDDEENEFVNLQEEFGRYQDRNFPLPPA